MSVRGWAVASTQPTARIINHDSFRNRAVNLSAGALLHRELSPIDAEGKAGEEPDVVRAVPEFKSTPNIGTPLMLGSSSFPSDQIYTCETNEGRLSLAVD